MTLVRLARPFYDAAEAEAAARVVASGQLVAGPEVARFEGLLSEVLAGAAVVAVSSGTTALYAALQALGVGPGDEVVVPAFTFPAAAAAVVAVGAEPLAADVDLRLMAIGPAEIAPLLGPRTRAVVLVHPFGLPADALGIRALCDPLGIALVEDAACAIGVSVPAGPLGTLGVLGTFSFHPRKVLTTGEGGAVCTRDPALADRLRALRNIGGVREGGRIVFREVGLNLRLPEVAGAIGGVQVGKLDRIVQARRAIADWYDQELSGLDGVTLPLREAFGGRGNDQSYVVLLDERLDRDRVQAGLAAREVESTLGGYALHRELAYRDRPGMKASCPNADRLFRSSLALPIHPSLARDEVDRVVMALREVVLEVVE